MAGSVRLAKYTRAARQAPKQHTATPLRRLEPGAAKAPSANADTAVKSMPVHVTETGSPRQTSTASRTGAPPAWCGRQASQFNSPCRPIPRAGAARTRPSACRLPAYRT